MQASVLYTNKKETYIVHQTTKLDVDNITRSLVHTVLEPITFTRK